MTFGTTLATWGSFGTTLCKSWHHGVNPGGSERTNGSKTWLKMKPDFHFLARFLSSFDRSATKWLRVRIFFTLGGENLEKAAFVRHALCV